MDVPDDMNTWLDDAALLQLLSDPSPVAGESSQLTASSPLAQRPIQWGNEASFPTQATATGASARTSAAPSRRVGKNASRERLKDELRFLRAKVAALEQQASELQAKKLAEQHLTVSAWEPVCRQQAALREQAERENTHLKHVLARQISVGKSLETLLHKRSRSHSHADLYDCSVARPAPDSKRWRGDEDTATMLFMQFEREIDERLYPMVDKVLGRVDLSQASTLDWVKPPRAITRTNRSGREQVLVELWDHKWVPFSFASACDAAWRAAIQEYSSSSRDVEASVLSPQLIAQKDKTVIRYRNEERSLSGAVVIKKFIESDRMILVCRSMARETSANRRTRRAYMDEMTWGVVQRVDDSSRTFDGESAVAVVCSHSIPLWGSDVVHGDGSSSSSSRGSLDDVNELPTGEFTNMILAANAGEMASIAEKMESILLEDTLAQEP